MSKILRTALAAGALVLLNASGALALGAASLDEAKALSTEKNLPILIDFYADWCGPCKAFTRATETDAALQSFLEENVVLFKVDAEKGAGIALAREHAVRSYPTFVLTNTDGETLDRWLGFGGAPWFIETAKAAVTDPVTANARMKRMAGTPNEVDAKKLGELRQATGHPGDAIAFYRRAQELAPTSETNYEAKIFGAMSEARAMFTVDAVRAQADKVLAAKNTQPGHFVDVAFAMKDLTADATTKDAYLPYLVAAMKATEGATDEQLVAARAQLAVDHALYVEKDNKKALAARLATLPKGWEKTADGLNSAAWWCFENGVELEKAEKWARKGVSLAASGTEKANVLDTLAEICAATGDCGDSVDYIRLAIQEDPTNEYFKKQLVKFEALLAEQKNQEG